MRIRPKIIVTTRGISEETGLEAWSETLTYYPPLICWPWYWWMQLSAIILRTARRLGKALGT